MPFNPKIWSVYLSGLEDLEKGLPKHKSNRMCSAGGWYLFPQPLFAHLQEVCHVWNFGSSLQHTLWYTCIRLLYMYQPDYTFFISSGNFLLPWFRTLPYASFSCSLYSFHFSFTLLTHAFVSIVKHHNFRRFLKLSGYVSCLCCIQ